MSPTGYVCAVVAGLALAYAVEEGRRLAGGRLMRYVSPGQAVRRILGSVLVAVLMGLCFAGLELIDPRNTPRRFITTWGVASLLTVLLLALAMHDLRAIRRHREAERERELRGAHHPGGPGDPRGD